MIWLGGVGILGVVYVVRRGVLQRRGDDDALTSHPSVQREMRKKARLRAAAAARGPGKSIRAGGSSSSGLPEGQVAARKWILLDLGLRPAPGTYSLDPAEWRLTIILPGRASAELTMADVVALGVQRYNDDWHCVTGWSALGLAFDGVPLASVLDHPKVRAAAEGRPIAWTWLIQRSADGYTAPVCREDAMAGGAFLALAFDGQPLGMDHGGPRLVLPTLFGWKSAKWMVELELLESFAPGFWERLGCHPRGRVHQNERFREGWSAAIWAWLAAAPGVYRRLGGYSAWVFVMQAGGSMLGAFVSLSQRISSRRSTVAPP